MSAYSKELCGKKKKKCSLSGFYVLSGALDWVEARFPSPTQQKGTEPTQHGPLGLTDVVPELLPQCVTNSTQQKLQHFQESLALCQTWAHHN